MNLLKLTTTCKPTDKIGTLYNLLTTTCKLDTLYNPVQGKRTLAYIQVSGKRILVLLLKLLEGGGQHWHMCLHSSPYIPYQQTVLVELGVSMELRPRNFYLSSDPHYLHSLATHHSSSFPYKWWRQRLDKQRLIQSLKFGESENHKT